MFSVYKLIFRKLVLQVFEHMIWQTVICGVCATGGTAEEKQQRFRKTQQAQKVWTKNDESYPWCLSWQAHWRQALGDDPLQQLLCSAMGTAQRQLSPQSLCLETSDAWGLMFLHCARLFPQPGPACPLQAPAMLRQVQVCHWMQGDGKGSGFHAGRRVCPRVRRGWVHLHTTQHLFSDLCSPFVSPGSHLFVWAWLLYVSQALLFFLNAVLKMRFTSKK